MRVMVYNIAYGTGAPKSYYHHITTAPRYMRTSHTHLDKIMKFIEEADPDVLGLVEVDTGSYRTKFVNQVEKIACYLNHHHQSSVKYKHNFLAKTLPIFRNQANAVLTKDKMPQGKFHYFTRGMKRLIIEVNIGGLRFFLVHLALKKEVRKIQLAHLAKLAKGRTPVIIAGDFNTFSGAHEIEEFQEKLGLINPNTDALPTFPSWKPKKQLDFILCSKYLKIKNFEIPKVNFSDHLPLILDFKI
ncbi:MAG: endonuclease/exonuclease/phosphatase family protein [Victivallales bacterium]